MITLLEAAKAALPGAEWVGDDRQVRTKDSCASITMIDRATKRPYQAAADGGWQRKATLSEASRWIRARIIARRDALDMALGVEAATTAWQDRCLEAEDRVRFLEALVSQQSAAAARVLAHIDRMWEGHAAQTGHRNAEHCIDAECEVRGAVDCPHGEELHYHHDGCPACDMDDPNDLPFPEPDCSETEHVAGCRHYTEVADYSKLGTVDLPKAAGIFREVDDVDTEALLAHASRGE